MHKLLLPNNIAKQLLLGIIFLLLQINTDALALGVNGITCTYQRQGTQFFARHIIIVQNGPSVSESYNDTLICTKTKPTTKEEITFLLPPNPQAPGVNKTSYKELRPSLIKGTAQVTIQGQGPYSDVVLKGAVDLFTGDFQGAEKSVSWSWLEGHDTARFNVNIDIPDLQLKSNHIIESSGFLSAGGTLVSFYTEKRRLTDIYFEILISATTSICQAEMFTTEITPTTVDFGSIDKKDLIQGKFFTKNFSLATKKNDPNRNCKIDITPKITLKSNQLIDDQTISLDNGLMLQIEKASGEKIKFNKPISYDNSIIGNTSTGSTTQKFNAIIQKNPAKDIKAGPFDTTVIYMMEYI